MRRKFGDEWDIRTYAFLKRFESEGYLIKMPSEPETLEAFPTPRAWTTLSVLLYRKVNSDDLINGLVGSEVGMS